MALIHALMSYHKEGRVASFKMHNEKKATVILPTGKSFVVYMSDDYIIGEAEVREAADYPRAKYLIYNDWDEVGQSAFREGSRLGIEIYKFGAFGYKIDELNASS